MEIGDDQSTQTLVGPETKLIDLEGKLLLPGAHDARSHVGCLADSFHGLNLSQVKNINQLKEVLASYYNGKKEEEWIRGGGLNLDLFEGDTGKELARWDLGDVTPDNPIVLDYWDGHSFLLNSYALGLSGVTEGTPNPDGDRIQKKDEGKLNEHFIDIPAAHLATACVPKLTVQELKDNFLEIQKMLNKEGYTLTQIVHQVREVT